MLNMVNNSAKFNIDRQLLGYLLTKLLVCTFKMEIME